MNTNQVIMDLQDKIEKVNTENLDISFNELLDMYEGNELKITPEFQRLFRWTPGASSRLIESLLLEMPIPPMYVVEVEDHKYELIDGLQRFSSYLHLRGKLASKEKGIEIGDKLTLQDCDIVESLNGLTYDDLPTSLQIRLKRSFVRIVVIKHGSDPKYKYHMFKRLNTGGVSLSSHEVRNCTIRLLDNKFNDFLYKLSEIDNYKTCIDNISDQQKMSGFPSELVLRFFAFKNYRSSFSHDIGDFLTEYMEKVTLKQVPFDYQLEEDIFKKTFHILNLVGGSRIFGRLNKAKNDLQENFSVYQFEAITLGLQNLLSRIDTSDSNNIDDLKSKILILKSDEEYLKSVTGGGLNSTGVLTNRISKVEELLR